MSILLLNMGFSKAFVIQDHVAATFGAGLGNLIFQTFNIIVMIKS